MPVVVLPTKPELEILSSNRRNNQLEINDRFVAKCSSRNGVPAAKLAWFLDDEMLNEQLGPAEVTETPVNKNVTLYTTTQTITRVIRATDDHKKLICRAKHIAQNAPQESSVVLLVRCKCYKPQIPHLR